MLQHADISRRTHTLLFDRYIHRLYPSPQMCPRFIMYMNPPKGVGYSRAAVPGKIPFLPTLLWNTDSAKLTNAPTSVQDPLRNSFPSSVPSSNPTLHGTTIVPPVVSSDSQLPSIPVPPHHSSVTPAKPPTSEEFHLIQRDHIPQAPQSTPSPSQTTVRSYIPTTATSGLDMPVTPYNSHWDPQWSG